MSKKLKKLIILCGGTGGHFFPGLSVARFFNGKDGKACLITGKHKINYKEKYSNLYGIKIFEINSRRISKNPFRILMFFFKFILGFFQSMRIFLKEKPDAVLAMGSYTSIPSGMAAVFMRIPLFLHDGNCVIGRANLFLARWAKLLMVAFPPVNKGINFSKVTVTGMPLRPELVNSGVNGKKEALKLFNSICNKTFTDESHTILVFGGSLGAKTINTVIPEAIIKMCADRKLQVIHLTGADDFKQTSESYKNIEVKSLVLEKFDNMALLYHISDLVICRSGGSTVTELEFFNKQAILIPYPHASENHQYYNALYYAGKGKADIIEDKNCTVSFLADKISERLKTFGNIPQEIKIDMKNPAGTVLEKIREFI